MFQVFQGFRSLASRAGTRSRDVLEFPAQGRSRVDLRARPESLAALSDARWRRGAEFLGTRHPIMGGAMTWVSDSQLVASISNAGAFGVLAGGALDANALDQEIAATYDLTDRPFGVNIITFAPDFDAQLEACVYRQVSHVIIGGGIPSAEHIKRAKRAGGKVLAFAASLPMAERALRNGADALIAEGREAGGHVGPLATSVLVQELLPLFDRIPVFVAGGIGRGEMIAHYLQMGAAGCQLGTRFVCARESRVHPKTKLAYLNAAGRDAVLSVQVDPEFRVTPVRALANKASRAFVELQQQSIQRYRAGELTRAEVQNEIERFWAGRLRRAVIEGDTEFGSLMAGQSVAFVTSEESVAEIVEELVAQAVRCAAFR
jgi:enoyl-[acyl-carrier protein] reductase II